MKPFKHRDDRPAKRRHAGGSRILRADEAPDRRAFLRIMAAQGISMPAAFYLFSKGATATEARAAEVEQAAGGKSALGAASRRRGAVPKVDRIVRDFSDPYIELIRMLHEACEIEHALMIQYLYCAFSLKPAYENVRGFGAPNTTDLLGIAIQEMQHLGKVNRLLVDLGAAPSVMRQDFPYEPDIYPFEFSLEPFSRKSIAKYLYTEAPAGALQWANAKTKQDRDYLTLLNGVLGESRPNHVGSFYDVVLRTVEEVQRNERKRRWLLDPVDLDMWTEELVKIKEEGEEGHYTFFKSLFLGDAAELKAGHPDVWSLPVHHAAYPARPLPTNPSAYVGHPNQIADPVALSIAWLGNMHYWVTLFLLDLAYRSGNMRYLQPARELMTGPFFAIATILPTMGAGIPCDPLSMGYSPGRDARHTLNVIARMMRETEELAIGLDRYLPGEYSLAAVRDVAQEIQSIGATTH